MAKDYYKILGINKNASEEEIKKAYHKMARLFHPDRPGGNEAKFKEINEAYQVLSNKEKKAQYDQFGQTFEGGGFSGGPFGWGGKTPYGDGFSFDFGDFGDIEDIFGNIFSGFGSRSTGRRGQQGRDMAVEINITLDEAFFGKKEKIEYDIQTVCNNCGGTGAKSKSDIAACSVCGGTGKIKEYTRTFFGNFSRVNPCHTCHGTGKTIKERCPVCGGKGKILERKNIDIDIKPGVKNGQIIKIIGMAGIDEPFQTPGDLLAIIKIKPHHLFKRKDDDLYMNQIINIAEAALGGEIDIPLIEGKTIAAEIPAGASSGKILRIKNKGMAKYDSRRRGDLFIAIEVKTPVKLSKKAKELLEELKKEF